MSETKTETKRVAMSRSTVDGGVCKTKFFIGGVDHDDNITRELATAELPTGIQAMLCAYGASAAAKAQYHGVATTPKEALDLYEKFVASLRDGSWSPGRGAGESGPSILVLAYERWEQSQHKRNPEVVTHTRQEVEATIEALSPAQKRTLHASAELAPHIRDIKIEQARETAKTAKASPNLLGSLFGGGLKEAAE